MNWTTRREADAGSDPDTLENGAHSYMMGSPKKEWKLSEAEQWANVEEEDK